MACLRRAQVSGKPSDLHATGMTDNKLATIATRATETNIKITRPDANSFDVKRGDSEFWLSFTASYSADDFQAVSRDGVQGKTVIAPTFLFHISANRQAPKRADLRRLAKEVGVILQNQMPSAAVVQNWRGTPID